MGQIRIVAAAMLLFFLGGWCAWFFPYDDLLDRSGTPLGADFSMFYAAGQLVRNGYGERLYDPAAHQQRLQQLFPRLDPRFALPYRYPPAVASLMAPLAGLPYSVAFLIFLTLSCAAYWVAVRLLTRHAGLNPDDAAANETSRWWIWAAVGWPVALETLIGGQASLFALLIATATYVLLRGGRHLAAGAVLGLALYKPNVLALVVLGGVLRYPRMLLGCLPVAAAFVLLSLLPAGWEGLEQYSRVSRQLALDAWDLETPHWKVHGLAPLLTAIDPDRGRLVSVLLGVVGVLLVTAWYQRSGDSANRHQPLWFASLLSINALSNPYLPIYDMTVLLAGAWLTAAYLRRDATEAMRDEAWPIHSRPLSWQLAFALFYFGPHLSQAIARSTGWQPFTLALMALAALQMLALRRATRQAPLALPAEAFRRLQPSHEAVAGREPY